MYYIIIHCTNDTCSHFSKLQANHTNNSPIHSQIFLTWLTRGPLNKNESLFNIFCSLIFINDSLGDIKTVWSLKCCLPWTILDSPVDRERFCSSLKALMILLWFSLSAEKWDIMLLKKLYNWNKGTTPALQINFICWRNGKQTRDEPIIATLKPITDAVFVFILFFLSPRALLPSLLLF